MKIKRICNQCGKELKQSQSKFCSYKCANKSREKRVKCICKQCGKEFHIILSQKNKVKFCSKECYSKWMAINLTGKNNPNWRGGGIKRICKQCKKEFKVKTTEVKRGKGIYCSNSCKAKDLRKRARIPTHHTKPELIFEGICKKHDLPYKYTGDGSFWIGKNPTINPDFVECNGKKIAIEIFGDYYHSPLLNYKIKEDRTLSYRKKILKKYGWKLIVFWQSDLLRSDAELFVLNILQKE